MSDAFVWHGGRLDAARAHYGDRREGWVDLSTGLNPVPWPVARAPDWDWAALPSVAALAGLEQVAARFFGLDPAHLCAVPGSEIALRLLSGIVPGPGRHIAPAYRSHGAVFPASDGGGTLLLANPNNPDGHCRSRAEMDALLHQQEQQGEWLIIDEAFADARPEHSMAAAVADGRRLIVLRSFGKFFGLGGVRLGFVLGPVAVIAAYRRRLGDWPVHAAALAIGAAAYADGEWIASARADIDARADRLARLLRGHGFAPVGDCPLFTLVETDAAPELFERLAQNGVLTRRFDYAPRWLRLGLPGGEDQWERLDEALRDG
ncbi:threonine-phosphate decarboxylase [uncultured Croceicoccus sp.]|uniref:threonine-phosphate decarboxylase n=1 Tax=uncultured Croceicoccus sp. TaxID=1295329 RepID=UPI00261968CE|nr:threonine-phosphate decarboxylase [uncultured Croceicoccus sp.]